MRSRGHGIPTALLPSDRAALYSSSVATQTTTSPHSVVEGTEITLKPGRQEPSSVRRSTCCPGPGRRGGLFKSANLSLTAEPPTRTNRASRRCPHYQPNAAP